MVKRIPNTVWFFLFFWLVLQFGSAVWRASEHPAQIPRVNTQQQSKNSGIGQGSIAASPSYDASEVAFLGVKPGEWLLAFVTFLLWVSTQLLVREAKKSSQRQVRAYLSVQPTAAINVYPERTPRVEFIIKNTGQTPAYNVRYVAIAEPLEHPLVDDQGDLVSVDPASKPPNLAVHSQAHITGNSMGEKPLTFDEWAKISQGNWRFYVAGIVLYDDVFGKRRKTQFCAYVGGPIFQRVATQAYHIARGETLAVEWEFSHVHNKAT